MKRFLLCLFGLLGLTALADIFAVLRLKDRPEIVMAAWTCEFRDRGAVLATPAVDENFVYVSCICDRGLTSMGAVHAISRVTGRIAWTFSDGDGMARSACSPALHGRRLFVGEGLHADRAAKLYGIDCNSRRKLWEFAAMSHIESRPLVVDDTVVFGAGDDGVYAVGADDGKQRWHFAEPVHVDTAPVVFADTIVVSSGVSRRTNLPGVMALSCADGSKRWHVRTDLPAWGGPLIVGNAVVVGLGRVRTGGDPTERGAVLALDATTGKELWRVATDAPVTACPATDGQRVYASDERGVCRALDMKAGVEVWRHDFGGAVVAGLTMAESSVVVIGKAGRVVGLRKDSGRPRWEFDAARSQAVFQSAPASAVDGAGRVILYLGCEFPSPAGSTAAVYAIRLP